MSPTLPDGPSLPSVAQLAMWLFRPVQFLEKCARRYGDCFTVRLPLNPPFVLFSDPAAIKELFTGDPDDLHAGEGNRRLATVVGDHSLLLLDGARHLRERKLMMPPFHGERMRAYGEAMLAATARNLDAWPEERAFAVHPEMQAITLDVILRTVFGLEDEDRLGRMRDLLVGYTTMGSSRIATALLMFAPIERADRLRREDDERRRAGQPPRDVPRYVPWRDVYLLRNQVDDLLYDEIARRRRDPGAASRADVLSMLLGARDESGAGMTDQELRDEMMTLLLAGHETSATTLAWAVHHLIEHPDVLARVRDELDRVAGGEAVTPDQVGRLEYVDAVIKETMRLTPILPLVARKLTRDMTIGGRALPAGVVAMPAIYLAHHRADLWPDPLRFDPDRFVGQKTDPYQFFPFGGGTRRCLGAAFATYEMKLVLAEVARRMDLAAAPGARVRMVRRSVTLAPSGGVRVVARRRVTPRKVAPLRVTAAT